MYYSSRLFNLQLNNKKRGEKDYDTAVTCMADGSIVERSENKDPLTTAARGALTAPRASSPPLPPPSHRFLPLPYSTYTRRVVRRSIPLPAALNYPTTVNLAGRRTSLLPTIAYSTHAPIPLFSELPRVFLPHKLPSSSSATMCRKADFFSFPFFFFLFFSSLSFPTQVSAFHDPSHIFSASPCTSSCPR